MTLRATWRPTRQRLSGVVLFEEKRSVFSTCSFSNTSQALWKKVSSLLFSTPWKPKGTRRPETLNLTKVTGWLQLQGDDRWLATQASSLAWARDRVDVFRRSRPWRGKYLEREDDRAFSLEEDLAPQISLRRIVFQPWYDLYLVNSAVLECLSDSHVSFRFILAWLREAVPWNVCLVLIKVRLLSYWWSDRRIEYFERMEVPASSETVVTSGNLVSSVSAESTAEASSATAVSEAMETQLQGESQEAARETNTAQPAQLLSTNAVQGTMFNGGSM